jgi:hypothetical protein
MRTVKTFVATIWVGLQERDTGKVHTLDEVYSVCQSVCNKGGLCVSITATRFIYKDGYEDGCAVGLINYPRFPESKRSLTRKAISLAALLLEKFKQYKVSVVCNGKTYMVERKTAPPCGKTA